MLTLYRNVCDQYVKKVAPGYWNVDKKCYLAIKKQISEYDLIFCIQVLAGYKDIKTK